MAETDASGDIFDLRRLRGLVKLMKDHDLGEIDLRQNDVRVRIRRGGEATIAYAAPPAPAAATPAERGAPASEAPPAESSQHAAYVTSPVVGTFYPASSPEAAPYVKVGDLVSPDTTVCLVEAMKVFNEIAAGVSGRIVAVLCQPGEPVEFGQQLFKVDTRG
ncbi:MAG: acetyl-CoA carboxylase biotin carboxyl carrier protein [Pirellulales bacterium]